MTSRSQAADPRHSVAADRGGKAAAHRRLPRSYLYVPADQPDKLARAAQRNADALILDLEDAVPLARKASSRDAALAYLRQADSSGPQIWIRINAGPEGRRDLAALGTAEPITVARLTGLCVAKTESAKDIAQLDRELSAMASPCVLLPLVESAAGVFAARDIAACPRVCRLQIGEIDLSADLGIEPNDDGLAWARATVVAASAAAGIEPPVAAVRPDFGDSDAFTASTLLLKRLGFFGRACIHPAQIPLANAAFTPTQAEITRAKMLLDLEGEAGTGATASGGAMIDAAVLRVARRTLGLPGDAETGT